MDPRILEGFGNFAQRQYDTDPLRDQINFFGESFDEQIHRKADASQIPAPPLWQSLVPREDVSFPRIMLNRSVRAVNLNARTGSGPNDDNIFTHDHSMSASPRTHPFYTPNNNEMHLAFIRAATDRVYDTVGLMVGMSSLPIRNLSISVYRLTDSGLEHLHTESNPDQWMTPGRADLRLRLPIALTAYRNEIFAVGIRQSGTGNGRPIAGVEMEQFEADHEMWPPALSALTTSGTGIDIPRGSLGFGDFTWVPWVSLGESGQILDYAVQGYSDNFNRANSSNLGPNWSTYGSGIEIFNNNVRRWATQGVSGALWVQPLNYDDMEVECTLGSFIQNQGIPSYLVLRSNSRFSSGMALQFANTSFRFGITRITGFNSMSSELASASNWANLASGQRIRFRVEGNRYRVYQNDVLRIDYTDPLGIPGGGPTQRFCGFYVWSNRDVFNNTHPSTHLASWAARDLAVTS